MNNTPQSQLSSIAAYYSNKLRAHGATAKGVDWNSVIEQIKRFEQLAKILPENPKQPFSVTDLGCGYGAFFEFLENHYENLTYAGIDVSPEMANAAREVVANSAKAHIAVGSAPPEPTDYCVASGIFNVRLDQSNQLWSVYIEETLDVLNEKSIKGFSANFLTSYSDEDKKREDLYYADPLAIFDHCKLRYSKNIALLHDYDFYEFTILVRKT